MNELEFRDSPSILRAVRRLAPRMLAVGTSDWDSVTDTVFTALPHAPRKLHNVAWMVYVVPGRSLSLGITDGGLNTKLVRRNAAKVSVASALAGRVLTLKVSDVQGRPADPAEVVRSISKELQPPMEAGADMLTTGAVGCVAEATDTI